jgi:hypothetical protein
MNTNDSFGGKPCTKKQNPKQSSLCIYELLNKVSFGCERYHFSKAGLFHDP